MFTEQQLEHIQSIARKKKNQGELSVWQGTRDLSVAYLRAAGNGETLFSLQQDTIIRFCAEECKRQRSGEMSVYNMLVAWTFTYGYWEVTSKLNHPITFKTIETIGQLVEPFKNKNGFRKIPIGVGHVDEFGVYHWIEKAQYAEIPRLLEHLLNSYYSGVLYPDHIDENTPVEEMYSVNPLAKSAEDQFYYDYENIHPFVDGNGRSGKILYNYLKNTLDSPEMPSNYWGASNP